MHIDVQENVSLKPYNTFGIDVRAQYFARFNTIDQLSIYVSKHSHLPTFILGGGSNILLTGPYQGIVLKNEIPGIVVEREDEDFVYVRVGAGENWHRFVLFCIENNLQGVENLSLIPGNTGASPMQNIGAYGVEIKDVFFELEAFHLKEKRVVKFELSDCEFAYRESVFKTKFKGEFVIISVCFRLNKQPSFNIEYGAIRTELDQMNISELSIGNISQAVINIRRSKLPDPLEIGNAGSFFKNPQVSQEKFESLQEQFPNVVGYPTPPNQVKLAAGWLIEQCGWKGFRAGDAGCHSRQALVLVNYGNAGGDEIFQLSQKIIESVYQKFAVQLEVEVNIL